MSNNTFTTAEAVAMAVAFSLLTAVMVGLIGYASGFKKGVRYLEKDAVTQGYAEYVADSEGDPQWQWIDADSAQPIH
jgi:hypothetical protein